MPKTAFLLVEVGVYILAISCLRHAWARGWSRLLGLVAGMIYGVLLEYGAIVTFHAYVYGHFLIMIFGAVPLCIGVSWGMIIYTAMETSDRFALPWYLRPILDALLALTIDLSMDAIAIRLGFWTWGQAGAVVRRAARQLLRLVHRGVRVLAAAAPRSPVEPAGPLVLLADVAVAILAIALSVVRADHAAAPLLYADRAGRSSVADHQRAARRERAARHLGGPAHAARPAA